MVTINKHCCIIGIIALISSCADSRATKKKQDIKRIIPKMTVLEVKSIMGEPDSIFNWPTEPNKFRYMYNSSFGMSDNYYIIFSKIDSIVVSVNDGS